MADEPTQEQIERAEQIKAARLAAGREQAKRNANVATEPVNLNFFQKATDHWLILAVAAFFDLFALIPFVSVIVNACFGMILFLYFGPKGKGGELTKIALPIAIGSIFDFFLSILPVNIAAAAIRITLN